MASSSSPITRTNILPTYVPAQNQAPLEDFPLDESQGTLEQYNYILCNELEQFKLLEALPVSSPNSVHLGFSCWLNFDLIATRKPELAIICDIDPNMIGMLNLLRDSIIASYTPQEFTQNFWTALVQHFGEDFKGIFTIEETLKTHEQFSEAINGNGWLQSADSFQLIKNMYSNKQIIHRQLDLTASLETFQEISEWAEKHGFSFDTIYISNIPEWADGKKDEINRNLKSLISSNTFSIASTRERGIRSGSPSLTWTQGHMLECLESEPLESEPMIIDETFTEPSLFPLSLTEDIQINPTSALPPLTEAYESSEGTKHNVFQSNSPAAALFMICSDILRSAGISNPKISEKFVKWFNDANLIISPDELIDAGRELIHNLKINKDFVVEKLNFTQLKNIIDKSALPVLTTKKDFFGEYWYVIDRINLEKGTAIIRDPTSGSVEQVEIADLNQNALYIHIRDSAPPKKSKRPLMHLTIPS